jgi:hypothetical protein
MPDDKLLTTEEALKKLIKETDRAVAKAQAAMAMVVGTANPEPKAAETEEAGRASPPTRSSPAKGDGTGAWQAS